MFMNFSSILYNMYLLLISHSVKQHEFQSMKYKQSTLLDMINELLQLNISLQSGMKSEAQKLQFNIRYQSINRKLLELHKISQKFLLHE
jgi:hypothetical protein